MTKFQTVWMRTLSGIALTLALFGGANAEAAGPPSDRSAAQQASDSSAVAVDGSERTLVIIVPYGKGGGSYQLAMAMAQALQPILGVSVNVVSMPGSSGVRALQTYMKMAHDGYAIMENIDVLASQYASKQIAQEFTEMLAPLAIAQIVFSQIYMRSGEDRFRTWSELVSFVKENPGGVRIANVGSEFSMERVNVLMLEDALGIAFETKSYDRPEDRYQALLSGEVDLLFEQPGDVQALLRDKLIKPILTLSETKPTTDTDGFLDLLTASTPSDLGILMRPLLRFRGFFIHADVAPERRAYLEKAIAEAYRTPDFQAFNREHFMQLLDSYRNAEEATALFQQTVDAYRALYEELGLF